EQNPKQWWKAMKELIERLYSFPASPSRKNLDIIAIDAMAPTVLPVDVKGKPLRNAIIWMDRRAMAEHRAINESLNDLVFEIGGNRSDASNFAPKARWIKDKEPETYLKTAKFLSANGYFVRRLCGTDCLDISQCGLSQLCETPRGIWSETLIDRCGLDREKLPEISECTDIVGTVSGIVAAEIGIEPGVKVIAGAMDNAAAVLGTGTIADGSLNISAGTASNVNLCTRVPHFTHSFLAYRHIAPGCWIHAGSVDYGGAGYKWFAGLLNEGDYGSLDARAQAIRPGERPVVFLPYMVGQRAPLFNSRTRGVLFGMDPAMSDGELARAFMEGNAMGMRKVLALMGEFGVEPRACRLTGGCARSSVYSQIIADVLNLEIHRVGRSDSAALGAAMAGAKAAGYFDSYEEMIQAAAVSERHHPNPMLRMYYDELYHLFERLYHILEPEFEALSSLTQNKELK
ncbi:MAG: hypothetical protein B6D68_00725, partial [spirochete symbiont of Stewartia floridana]